MKHSVSLIVILGVAGALVTLALTPACSSTPTPKPRPANADASGARTAAVAAPESVDPGILSPLVGRWSTRVIRDGAETLINVVIRRDGTVRLRRVRQDNMQRSEAAGMVSPGGDRLLMDDGLTYELQLRGDHLVAKRLLTGQEFVLSRL